jgi:hypothetical protein
MGGTPGMITLHSHAARLLAVEVLLAEPEALGDDVLESCLYILRDKLTEAGSEGASLFEGALSTLAGARPEPFLR